MLDRADGREQRTAPDDLDNQAAVETLRSRWEPPAWRPKSERQPAAKLYLWKPNDPMRFPAYPRCAPTARPRAAATGPAQSDRATGLDSACLSLRRQEQLRSTLLQDYCLPPRSRRLQQQDLS